MTQTVDRLSASAMRVLQTQERVRKMRNLADTVRHNLDLHRQAVSTLMLLEDSLYELTASHDLLVALTRFMK